MISLDTFQHSWAELSWETIMETDKSDQTRVITALLDLYQDSLGQVRTEIVEERSIQTLYYCRYVM